MATRTRLIATASGVGAGGGRTRPGDLTGLSRTFFGGRPGSTPAPRASVTGSSPEATRTRVGTAASPVSTRSGGRRRAGSSGITRSVSYRGGAITSSTTVAVDAITLAWPRRLSRSSRNRVGPAPGGVVIPLTRGVTRYGRGILRLGGTSRARPA